MFKESNQSSRGMHTVQPIDANRTVVKCSDQVGIIYFTSAEDTPQATESALDGNGMMRVDVV